MQSNPKIVFAQEMLDMENKLALLTGQNRQQCCYDLAVRYAQVCVTGDCWERALFGLSYVNLYPEANHWNVLVWDDQTLDYVKRIKPQSQQYQALVALREFEKQNAQGISDYVSRCDEYILFCRQEK